METLKVLLQKDQRYQVFTGSSTLMNILILIQIDKGHRSKVLNNYCDGKNFSSHPLFSVHTSALQIFFYYDDLEVCHPSGSKAKIHSGNSPCAFQDKYPSTYSIIDASELFKSNLLLFEEQHSPIMQ